VETKEPELDEATQEDSDGASPEPGAAEELGLSTSGLVDSIIVEKRPRGYRYTADDKITLVAAAKQRHTLGESWTDVAKALNIAYPTLKPMLLAGGIVIEGPGRRPKSLGTPRKTRSNATKAPRKSGPKVTASETPSSRSGAGSKFRVMLESKQFVDDNREELFRIITLGQSEGIKDAVRRLLQW
jgi:hypothetical protein